MTIFQDDWLKKNIRFEKGTLFCVRQWKNHFEKLTLWATVEISFRVVKISYARYIPNKLWLTHPKSFKIYQTKRVTTLILGLSERGQKTTKYVKSNSLLKIAQKLFSSWDKRAVWHSSFSLLWWKLLLWLTELTF